VDENEKTKFSKLFSGIRNWTFLKMSVFDFRKKVLEKAGKNGCW
jgi:hypothetical protein